VQVITDSYVNIIP